MGFFRFSRSLFPRRELLDKVMNRQLTAPTSPASIGKTITWKEYSKTMNETGGNAKYCLIGAGATGLAAVRAFQCSGLPFDCFEREDDVGGVWRYDCPSGSIYASTHLITSKAQSEFSGFAMPDSYPAYPSHRQVLEYLRAYARHHDLYAHITLNTSVESVEPNGAGWLVRLSDGSHRSYRGVVIANGHLWEPQLPELPGTFSGRSIHSRQYRSNDELRGKRVLVVGFGNSACDIVIESGRCAAATFHSVRRGRHFVPKFLFGKASDTGADWLWRFGAPLWMHRLLARLPLHAALIDPVSLGLPRPDHALFSEPVIPNEQYLQELGHGRFTVRPDVARFNGTQVEFTDGSSEEIDLVIFATGYKMRFPFLDASLLQWELGVPRLYLNIFHPQYDTLFFVGLSEPSTKTWEVAEHVARLISLLLKAQEANPEGMAWFHKLKAQCAGPVGLGNTQRSRFFDVEYHSYLRKLRAVFRRLGEELVW